MNEEISKQKIELEESQRKVQELESQLKNVTKENEELKLIGEKINELDDSSNAKEENGEKGEKEENDENTSQEKSVVPFDPSIEKNFTYSDSTNNVNLMEAYSKLGLYTIVTDRKYLKQKWQKMVFKVHPDRCKKSKQECEEAFKEITDAYKFIIESLDAYKFLELLDPDKKQQLLIGEIPHIQNIDKDLQFNITVDISKFKYVNDIVNCIYMIDKEKYNMDLFKKYIDYYQDILDNLTKEESLNTQEIQSKLSNFIYIYILLSAFCEANFQSKKEEGPDDKHSWWFYSSENFKTIQENIDIVEIMNLFNQEVSSSEVSSPEVSSPEVSQQQIREARVKKFEKN